MLPVSFWNGKQALPWKNSITLVVLDGKVNAHNSPNVVDIKIDK